ncbi:MAG TPA: WXG100 family type VII secretion target [Ktedonobacteraceae bacterium]|jgi:WXG100 family type VII secretion target|nr:WXG100 family type VII secretion target [Ktedonobacteraceae bacterium]
MAAEGQGLKAQYGGLSAAAANFDQRVQDLETVLHQVTAAVNNLQADWSGAGHMSFEAAITKWNGDVREMNTTLEEISRNVKESNRVYQDVDSAVQRSFGGFH